MTGGFTVAGPGRSVLGWRARMQSMLGGSRRPWYFCLNEEALPRYWEFAAVAVLSARERTRLSPICLYDGLPGPFTHWLRDQGVQVLHRRIGFWRDIEAALALPTRKRAWDLGNARGCFLRCEICLVEPRPIAFYADVDIVFLADPPYPESVEGEFAACREVKWDDFRRQVIRLNDAYCNTGIMYIDTRRYRAALPGFLDFCRARAFDFFAYDQGAMNNYFVGRWQRLSDRYNWRPFIGPPAEPPYILHFHGPKPDDLRAMARGEDNPFADWVARFRPLYDDAMARFDEYRHRPAVERLQRQLGY